MANNTATATQGDTDPALTVAKLPVVTADGEKEAEPVVETHPDIWDENGRNITFEVVSGIS